MWLELIVFSENLASGILWTFGCSPLCYNFPPHGMEMLSLFTMLFENLQFLGIRALNASLDIWSVLAGVSCCWSVSKIYANQCTNSNILIVVFDDYFPMWTSKRRQRKGVALFFAEPSLRVFHATSQGLSSQRTSRQEFWQL